MSRRSVGDLIGVAMIASAVLMAVTSRVGVSGVEEDLPPALGRAGAPTTSRDDLERTIERMERALTVRANNRDAAILLSDALLRQARVTGRAEVTRRAAAVLEPLLQIDPADYEARRMLATVYASEHRFHDAVREAERAREQQPNDPWNYGIIGDSHLELGEYDRAFAAYQTMLDLKPSAAAYSRVSYAFEVQGQLADAIEAMRLAADAASPRDPESIAWLHAHLAGLYMQVGRVPEARLEYAWAERAFPRHPIVRAGLARLKEFEGDDAGALAMYREVFDTTGMPDAAVAAGEIAERLGRRDEADRMYAAAEERWRTAGPAEQDHLASFLADHDRNVDEAMRLAETSAANAQDIVAQDALAWACFKGGRLREADRASSRALRTGTRNASILFHAATIRAALGDPDGARRLLDRVPRGARGSLRTAAALDALRARIDNRRVLASR